MKFKSKSLPAMKLAAALLTIAPFVVAMTFSAIPSTARAWTPFLGTIAPPTCEAGDRVETGVDGQLTLAERTSGASTLPYNCNLAIVGEYQGQGAGHQLMWHDHCAYYTTPGWAAGQPTLYKPPVPPLLHNGGTQVLDVSDMSDPRWVGHLTDPLYSWESPYVHQQREILAEGNSWEGSGPQPGFALYDVKNCEHPKMLFSGMFDNTDGWGAHGGQFSPDGNTYYITATNIHHLLAFDITDPKNPTQIVDWAFGDTAVNGVVTVQPTQTGGHLHRVWINMHPIGNYGIGDLMFTGQQNSPTSPGVYPSNPVLKNGLVVLDISDIQHRRYNPQVRTIGSYFWVDGSTSIEPQGALIGGVPFVASGDEDGSGVGGYPENARTACAAGLPPYGFFRLFDVSNPANPVLTAKLKLQVDDPANCAKTENDIVSTAGGYGYSTHDCSFDNPDHATLLACSKHQAGVRVFDIHNPYAPVELAYFKGPAPPEKTQQDPGSLLTTANGVTAPIDFAWSKMHSHFYWKGDQLYLWVTSSHGGFYTLRFEDNVMQKIRDLHPVPYPDNNTPNY